MKSNTIAQILSFFSLLFGANMIVTTIALHSYDSVFLVVLNFIFGILAFLCGIMTLIKSKDRENKELPYVIILFLLFLIFPVISIVMIMGAAYASGAILFYFELFLAPPVILCIVYLIKFIKENKEIGRFQMGKSPDFFFALNSIREDQEENEG